MLLKNFSVLPTTDVCKRECSNNSMSAHNYSLEILLDQEDILQQIQMNSVIADFVLLPTTLYRLVAYCTQLPLPNASEAECFRYPFLSCELLCTESPSFLMRFFDNDCAHVLEALWNFLAPEKTKKRRFCSSCRSTSSSKSSYLNTRRRHSLADTNISKPYNWTSTRKTSSKAVNDPILCGYFSRIVAAMYHQQAGLLTVYLKKKEWILRQLLLCCHQRAIADLVSGFLLQDTVSLTLYHPSRVMLALLVLIREDALFQESELSMDLCFRRQENILFILEQILFLENDGESFSLHRKNLHFEKYILSLTCPTACKIFLQCLTTFSVITIKVIVRILSLLNSVTRYLRNKSLNKQTLCSSSDQHSSKQSFFFKTFFSKPLGSYSLTSFLDSDSNEKNTKTSLPLNDTDCGNEACKSVFDKSNDTVKDSLNGNILFNEAIKNIFRYETSRDFKIWKYNPDVLFLKPCLLMYHNEKAWNHIPEELEVLAHCFFLEKWIAPFFQIIFQNINKNLSERENVVKKLNQSGIGSKSSNSTSGGHNSDDEECSITMPTKTNKMDSSKALFFDTTVLLPTQDSQKDAEIFKIHPVDHLSSNYHKNITGFEENLSKESQSLFQNDEKILLECTQNTENVFINDSRDPHTMINGTMQHEKNNSISRTLKSLNFFLDNDNQNMKPNTNKTTNFLVHLPYGAYPRIGIECISILKLATILLQGTKESRLLIATPIFLNTLVRWFVMNHWNTALHIAIAEIFQSIVLMENPLQKIEVLLQPDSRYTVQTKDNVKEERQCSEHILTVLLMKTHLLSHMTDIIKNYKQVRMEKNIHIRRKKHTNFIKGSFIHTLHLASLICIKTHEYPKELQDFLRLIPEWSDVIDEVLRFSNTLRVPLGGEAPKVENESLKRQEYILPLGLGCWIPGYKRLSNKQEGCLEKNKLNLDLKATEESNLFSDAFKKEQGCERQIDDTYVNVNSCNNKNFIFKKSSSHEECGIDLIRHLNNDMVSHKSNDDGHLLKRTVPSNVCDSTKISMNTSFLHPPTLKSFDAVQMEDMVRSKDFNFLSSATCTDSVDDLSFTIESISFTKPLDRWLGDLRLSFHQKENSDDSYLIDLMSRNVSVAQAPITENQKDS
ncbi:uncharacterized protein LOC128883840 isoform X2 [Hylaeus volcanicus]|uniref:uncharacterized protein LOC128883840 isoform X2 n=1 Tax=Hylaeus volcanicus TaxID=313075 RepID=UPI0023B81C78|nr:uncharacterized protein LOC128883840 isoform X2 [Hylaeus volcanicus]